MQLDSPEYWDQNVRRSISRLFILSALAGRPMHGYELTQAVAEGSGNCCAPSDAAIYPAIRDLSEGGFITCEAVSQGARQRNVCTLTDRGFDALSAATEAWGNVLPHLARVIDETEAETRKRRALA
ncbi:MAG: PadR family transcriptional regulator [Dehalococcoidia bacterium]|jgi:DNA-binding PadR family transcriptional regulator|nr:PadR family transcriptional regulator [Dehalococcoidia bacterium]